MSFLPYVTPERDALDRLIYWLWTSKQGPKVRVSRAWVELQLRHRMLLVRDKSPASKTASRRHREALPQ